MLIPYVPMDGFTQPTRGSDQAAGWDLYAAADTELRPFEPKLVPLAFSAAVPDGHVMLLVPRSSVGLKRRLILPNSVGVIDSDYRGQWMGIFTWIPHPSEVLDGRLVKYEDPILFRPEFSFEFKPNAKATYLIQKGERIAQALLVEYKEQDWRRVDALPETQRGSGGFGSTDSRG